MTKRKVGPMRPKTKEAMVRLAEIMVGNYKLEVIKGTPQFLEYAIHEAEENDLGISWQTIKLREQFLEMKCDELYKEQKSAQLFEESDEYDVFEDVEWYWANGDMVNEEAIIRRSVELQLKRIKDESKQEREFEIQKQQSFNQQIGNLVVNALSPNYSMFSVGEDGLRVLRGEYKGLYVHEIDAQRWAGCAIGWSRYQLKQNDELGANRKGALTEDDKNVFLDIISGKDV